MTSNSSSHRREKRGPTERTGIIKIGFFKAITCKVEDLSSNGAKLILENDSALPEKFELNLSTTGQKRKHKCANRWQKGNTVGVEFLSSKLS